MPNNRHTRPLITSLLRAIHRGDYQIVLWEEAKASGVKIMLDAEVTKVDTGTGDLAGSQVVSLKDGRTVTADIVVGADGKQLHLSPLDDPYL
jgi:2-polyprenyl-6-methoxyphenol hydroxylase-like FAD-dependent oxidoreductase